MSCNHSDCQVQGLWTCPLLTSPTPGDKSDMPSAYTLVQAGSQAAPRPCHYAACGVTVRLLSHGLSPLYLPSLQRRSSGSTYLIGRFSRHL